MLASATINSLCGGIVQRLAVNLFNFFHVSNRTQATTQHKEDVTIRVQQKQEKKYHSSLPFFSVVIHKFALSCTRAAAEISQTTNCETFINSLIQINYNLAHLSCDSSFTEPCLIARSAAPIHA